MHAHLDTIDRWTGKGKAERNSNMRRLIVRHVIRLQHELIGKLYRGELSA